MTLEITPLLLIFIGINIMAFLVMLWDKTQASKKGAERISEGMLFFMAIAFGAIGVYAGMFAFRHKTRKWYFILGVPLAIVENYATFVLVNTLLNQ
jgi:uncharacterized membrane protein YsdA (DUF1294 family)